METTALTYAEVAEDRNIDAMALYLYCDNHHITLTEDNVDDVVYDFQESFEGIHDSLADFGQDKHYWLTQDTPNAQVPASLSRYVDWEAYAENELRHDWWWAVREGNLYAFLSI